MNYVAGDVRKNGGKDCILVSLLVGFNRKKRLHIQLWILLLMEQYRQRMAARITGRLPDWASAGLLLEVDSIITKGLVGNDFKDGWNRLMEPGICVLDCWWFIEDFLRNKFKDIQNYNMFVYMFEICKIIEFSFNSKLKGFMFNWMLYERKYKWFEFCMKWEEEEKCIWGYDETQLLLCDDG